MSPAQSLMLLTMAGLASTQLMQRCSNYQTTPDFDDAYIEKMKTLPEGYIVRMSNGASDPCQRLQFVDGNDFNFTYIDTRTQTFQNYTDRYTTKTANLVGPAALELSLPARVLGSDSGSKLVLHPLIARDDMVAFVSCFVQGLGLYRTEQVLVFTPFRDDNTTSVEEIKDVLTVQGVPRVNELLNISTTCTTNPNHTVPFNLINYITNPFQRVAYAAQVPVGNVANVADQTLAFLRGQYVPANLYANRVEPSGVAAASAFDAFRRVSAVASSNPSLASINPPRNINPTLPPTIEEVRYLGASPSSSNSAFFSRAASSGNIFNVPGYPVGGHHYSKGGQYPGPSHARHSAQFYPVY